MVHQATRMSGNGKTTSAKPAQAISQNIAGFAHDVITLGELQIQLLKVDAREGLNRTMLPLALIGTGALLALACFPILVAGFAYWLIEGANFSHTAAFFTAGAAGLVVAATGLVFGWVRLRSSLMVLQRSQDEFRKNVKWVKDVLNYKRHH